MNLTDTKNRSDVTVINIQIISHLRRFSGPCSDLFSVYAWPSFLDPSCLQHLSLPALLSTAHQQSLENSLRIIILTYADQNVCIEGGLDDVCWRSCRSDADLHLLKKLLCLVCCQVAAENSGTEGVICSEEGAARPTDCKT